MTLRRAMSDPIPDVDHRLHGGAWLDACDGDTQARIAARLNALPLAIEVETPQGLVGLVHADFPYDDWQAIHGAAFSADGEDARPVSSTAIGCNMPSPCATCAPWSMGT